MESISLVLSCAGTGSRLGLGKTKALLDIHGYPLIAWQLSLFTSIEDLRIVVGYQSQDVIQEVLKYRKDVTFVYNHRYFETKTAESFYLGARHANAYVIEFDGDLIIHPEDMAMLLQMGATEYICYSEKRSEDAIYVTCDADGNVVSFSKDDGEYEWTGPACIQKKRLKREYENVYNQLEPLLPLQGLHIRACDIDTYEDYMQAKELFTQWYKDISISSIR